MSDLRGAFAHSPVPREHGAMRFRFLVVLVVPLLAACASAAPEVSPGSESTPAPVVVGNAATDLAAPWSMAILADGQTLLTHRDDASITLLQPEGGRKDLGQVEGVVPAGEGGLLGIAAAPALNGKQDAIYAYFTSADDNRVVRFNWDGKQLSNQQTVVDGIPKSQIHNGGRIAFGPDGSLYIATGDAGQPELAQDKTSLAGKILRVTEQGDPAAGNPDSGSPVYSLGHRNVQGLAWDDDGRLWASEFGENDVDELNQIEPGSNYGWPECEGRCDRAEFAQPAAEWSPTSIASPSGLAIADGSAWVASLRGERLWQVPLDGAEAGVPQEWFAGEFGRLRDATVGPDGLLWVATNNTDSRGTPEPGDDRILLVELPEAT
ncbi:MAG: glucose sorbosone dehydrogenase [Micrococcales bacterium]|nr:glucose sorbosone dehydrogenase [Micrococcales bacterium]